MGSGFALDSVRRLSYNRLLKKYRHARYNEMRDAVNKIQTKYHHFQDKSTLTDKELNDYKRMIKNRIRSQKLRTILISSFITLFIILSTTFIIKYLYHYFINQL